MEYTPTIGLEVHAELKTRTKMFCRSLNNPTETRPNVNVCPICLAHPGTLPVINVEAVKSVIRLGLALNGEILKNSHFDRKSYFYPDLPKGYQISQYEYPLVKGGELLGIELERIHLEEDTARLLHGEDGSLVDFNRAGIPLMELVTKPVIKSADEAFRFAKELQLIIRYLGISDADMEKGQMRVEANVSVAPEGSKELGTKVEVKNINSFKEVKNAIEYEIKRQTGVLEQGEKVIQETRGSVMGATKSQRSKESSHDYRYFPEPDLPPLDFAKGEINLEELKLSIPELPEARRNRFLEEYKLPQGQIEVLVSDPKLAEYFEESVSELDTIIDEPKKEKAIQTLVNSLTTDLTGLMNKSGIGFNELKISPENFAEMTNLISGGSISSVIGKKVLGEMFVSGLDPDQIIKEKTLTPIADEEALLEAVKEVIKANEQAVSDYKKGKSNALKFLVGEAMRKLSGRGNPGLLEKLFSDRLAK
ncbi:MAG: Asp-tRNA(Asn)/Glu-tRNA(Gln) amidotransferase subunit GatB [Candidatus Colwellbacteria bacterium]|nr:Asp-tRNA(Asn)/Glu-tRNA(Gln) amidotransferase subunit GatB [Candidatus Colwellbacteria bacterium]